MTQPSSEAAALAAIREMWEGRSAAERSAFASSLAAPPPAADTGHEDHTARVRRRAALSGAADPGALVIGLDAADGARVLDLLVPAFDRAHTEDGWRWTMRSGPRRETLHGLTPEALVAALADVGDIPTDEAGRYLRLLAARAIGAARPSVSAELGAAAGVVTGASGDYAASVAGALAGALPESVPEEPSPRVVLQALAWAEPLGGFAGDLAEARRRVRVEAVADSYGALLGNGFFGREEELLRLREFASAPIAVAGDVPVPLLPVVGLGGSGKSTALAAFAEPYLREILRPGSTGPVVIVIDFDRVQFRIDAELELSFEVTRQLGNAHPVAAADFSALRYQVRQERAGTAPARYTGSLAAGEGAGDATAFERDASLLVRMHELDSRVVLLILDTFEEWQRDRPDPSRPRLHDNDPEARILRWIARLRDTMDLRGLRVILSGRADVAIDPAGITGRVTVAEAVCLADLAPGAAAQLLVAHGVADTQAPALVELIGGNPLTLRVAARFFAHLSPAERDEFIAGNAASVRGLDGEMRREVLYERFLGHIPGPRVRRLAHPGLVLRRVTPDLIRHVLAPHCGLGDVTDDEAAELLERLADEVWLVKRDGDVLRHLPDVRRAMLHLMTSDPVQAGALAAIHRAAAAWYREGRDLTGEAAAVEVLYHELMLDGDEIMDAGDARLSTRLVALGDSVADLPATRAAEARVLRGELPPLADVLPVRDRIWARWVDRKGRTLLDNNAPGESLELLDARPVPAEPVWLAQAFNDLGRWDDYHAAAAAYGSGRAAPHRYHVVAAVVTATEASMFSQPDVEGLGADDEADYNSHVLTHYFYRLLLQRPDDIADWRRRDPRLVQFAEGVPAHDSTFSDLFPVDEFRRTLVWVVAGCPAGAFVANIAWPNGGEIVSRSVIERSPGWLWNLRGDNPELRAAVRTALVRTGDPAPPDADFLARIDRDGGLGAFLDTSVARWPEAALLRTVRDAFHRWDRANNDVIAAVIRDVEAGWPGT
ncbi:hypothetical protein [Catenuloplanes atrovinosus]|uniref:ABC-type amino acid transport substrate-binding protein n=1 Tax=Catenuloplanes atrovinosus TaxID=137266 RepID=A0AAE4C9Y6_9ACTN|nr:hypothetical protein [Catenuloplanes atrovinosus]MDR7274080.1 ABC-type amino acid transport substrate-binding protein [Catenuloplanes atrovinosus]